MVKCPVCNGAIDVDEEDVEEGDALTCDECGADLRVAGTDPFLELEPAEELDEDEEEDLEEDEEEDEDADEGWK